MPDEIRGEWIVQKNRGTSTMLRDLRKAAPWFALFVLTVVVGIGATKAARHCLIDRQFNIRLGAIHRVGAPFWGLSCERADAAPLRPVSVKPVALEHGN
jgi:hypothetical protein